MSPPRASADDPDSRRRRLVADPRARRASAELLGAALGSIAALSGLVLWHLARRGRLIRRRLGEPRPVRWPSLEEQPGRTPDPEP